MLCTDRFFQPFIVMRSAPQKADAIDMFCNCTQYNNGATVLKTTMCTSMLKAFAGVSQSVLLLPQALPPSAARTCRHVDAFGTILLLLYSSTAPSWSGTPARVPTLWAPSHTRGCCRSSRCLQNPSMLWIEA